MAFRCARLSCEVAASSITCRWPPDGRQAVRRCKDVSGVTLAFALTARRTASRGLGLGLGIRG